ncbi:protein-L-isoaspartate(D-aspartate) O-methyltransferase [Acetobacterium wieringae]|jgi:protein-L-isoaspartate(D-aspartate) O-methyltransferase|uniref:Protein-L-isoaspartate O-methyltransferase n=1 Tax=Acetobacterium wieringae TaxID=52694 RepID=A0A1F2PG56_9FIRM|nr:MULTISPECIES: protein-L-isoaspartate(D-aspartate) O-methyltransferase [Acetobacterium]OFV69686.1 protein-L-isoaspartate O-methyltransferase [Acetobacterium wieringae]TYC84143.1 protein-L-isoaspartate(D-aspartate) O-methyltransferase [Acetobacterium wieringae]URN85758.1 protein-L-isoaspartate(D-aspartate) O-methyltransferase [Acetobacterium wieringae]UYO64220.1 protein-L-isoaspartate(D-aspartate) O-methyltransferase [Acetobacterium wieringae]VUZ24246.1 Protein-L-isoaspartate O-methyltransfer
MDYQELSDFFVHLDRSYFIDNEMKEFADRDQPLSIGYEQTISQPSLVLEMTQILAPEKNSCVLEIGTGSGYQTALLARFSKMVYTIERIPELSETAQKRLNNLGYKNIVYKIGDGSEGWAEFAPFNRIIVTAAAERIPKELIDQLARGGKMIIPVGPPELQELKLICKDDDGQLRQQTVDLVRFVEMKGKYGWKNKAAVK